MGRIGHASIDENKHAKGGTAGDQTGKEVCIRDWYKKPWHTVIRANDTNVADRMATCCEFLCRSNIVGYDQNQRNTLRSELVKVHWNPMSLAVPCETDCSAFMSVCAEYAGVSMYGQYTNGNAPTTRNMVEKFYATGMFSVLTYKTYLESDNSLIRGDILVGNGHTAMCLDSGTKQFNKPILSIGSRGPWVKELQLALRRYGYALKVDGDFGQNTERDLISVQGILGITKDAVCGPVTYEKMGI